MAPHVGNQDLITQEYFCETSVPPGGKEIIVATSAYPTEIIAAGNALSGETLVLGRGRKIEKATIKSSPAKAN